MLVSLPVPVIIIADILGWLTIHMGAAYGMTQLPADWFNPDGWLFRERAWERDGGIYRSVFRVKRWKGLLPDGAALFAKGFRKGRIASHDTEYLRSFISETCRGELTHWAVLWCAPLFFIWNYWWAGWIMIAYALAANMPCIVAQRYNRIRLSRLVGSRRRESTLDIPGREVSA